MFFFTLSIPYTIILYLLLGRIISVILKYPAQDSVNNAIVGFIFTSIFALILNFFLPLNIITNIFYAIFVIIFFYYKKLKLFKNDFFFIISSSILVFLLLIYSTEYRPDAGLYHIPYTQILNEDKITLGLTNIHSRFGHISILQYSAGFNFNFLAKEIGILIPLACIASFLYFYFVSEVYKIVKEKNLISINAWLCLLVLIYTSYKINRYSEFGNDGTAHLFFLYVISMFLKINENNKSNINFFFMLSVFAFLNKVFFIFIFLIPIYLTFKKLKIINKIIFSIPSFVILIWLFKNILVSGCAIYPISSTCFAKLSWSDIQTTKKIHIESEAWAKAWPENKNNQINIEKFNKNFNWIEAWSIKHKKKIISIITPFLIITIILSIIINLNSAKQPRKIDMPIEKVLILSLICFFGAASFFLKYPIYRYGYSYIILLFFLVSLIAFKNINIQLTQKIYKFSLIFFFIIILSKQCLRVIKQDNEILPFYIIQKNKLKYNKIQIGKDFFLYHNSNLCFYGMSPCTNYKIDTNKIKGKKILNYKIIYNEKN
jgi:hypothetical protein